jgi:hypothetical protein
MLREQQMEAWRLVMRAAVHPLRMLPLRSTCHSASIMQVIWMRYCIGI